MWGPLQTMQSFQNCSTMNLLHGLQLPLCGTGWNQLCLTQGRDTGLIPQRPPLHPLPPPAPPKPSQIKPIHYLTQSKEKGICHWRLRATSYGGALKIILTNHSEGRNRDLFVTVEESCSWHTWLLCSALHLSLSHLSCCCLLVFSLAFFGKCNDEKEKDFVQELVNYRKDC